jgi:hypothetical protein
MPIQGNRISKKGQNRIGRIASGRIGRIGRIGKIIMKK